MSRKTFKEIQSEVPQPKPLTEDTELPYVLDLLFDCKTLSDLRRDDLLDDGEVLRYLAEAGFDTRNLKDRPF